MRNTEHSAKVTPVLYTALGDKCTSQDLSEGLVTIEVAGMPQFCFCEEPFATALPNKTA